MDAADSPRNRRFITIGISLILVTVIGLGALYIIRNYKAPVTLQSQARIPTLISAEQSTSIEIGGVSQDKVIEYTRTAINNIAVPDGEVMNLYYTDATSGTKKIISTGDFLLAIKSQIPSALFTTLDNTFMLGLYATDGERHPFLILQTKDFQIAFPSMFDWEYRIFGDLYTPFNLAGSETDFTNKFSDMLIENKSTRMLKRDDGSIGLVYGFADEKNLIITDSVETFKVVLKRVQSIH